MKRIAIAAIITVLSVSNAMAYDWGQIKRLTGYEAACWLDILRGDAPSANRDYPGNRRGIAPAGANHGGRPAKRPLMPSPADLVWKPDPRLVRV